MRLLAGVPFLDHFSTWMAGPLAQGILLVWPDIDLFVILSMTNYNDF